MCALFGAGHLAVPGGAASSLPSSGKGDDSSDGSDEVRARDCPTVPAAMEAGMANGPQPLALGQAVHRKGSKSKTGKAIGKRNGLYDTWCCMHSCT